MRAEFANRNSAGVFSGLCPSCGESISTDSRCGEEFECNHCSYSIQVENYSNYFLFVLAKVKLLPRTGQQSRMIDPNSYADY